MNFVAFQLAKGMDFQLPSFLSQAQYDKFRELIELSVESLRGEMFNCHGESET